MKYYNRNMGESTYSYYNTFSQWPRRYVDDYGYCFEDINSVLDDVSKAINEVRKKGALPELYKKLDPSEKKLLMELILNDPELL